MPPLHGKCLPCTGSATPAREVLSGSLKFQIIQYFSGSLKEFCYHIGFILSAL
ncbi:MAG: hypothetical protein J6W29_04475 [Neisseriaceae bacterium]|nr:hypothetical protein [Neisseriaceae bacterium]